MTHPTTAEPEVIFQEDELSLTRVNPTWTLDQLLEQPGLFFFKDVHALMNISRKRPGQIYRQLREQNIDPWTTYGLRKIWDHWVVKMSLFAPYYNSLNIRTIKRVHPSWDGNSLIIQKGVFKLAHVCTKIPFSSHQLRYRARLNLNAREDYGIWKEEDVFLVQMERFGPWVKSIWQQFEDTKEPKERARPIEESAHPKPDPSST